MATFVTSGGRQLEGTPPECLVLDVSASAALTVQYYNADGETDGVPVQVASITATGRITVLAEPTIEQPAGVEVISDVALEYAIVAEGESVPLGLSTYTWPANTPLRFGPALGWPMPSLQAVTLESADLDDINQSTDAAETATEAIQVSTAALDTNLGSKADSAAATDTGTYSVIAFIKRIIATYLAPILTYIGDSSSPWIYQGTISSATTTALKAGVASTVWKVRYFDIGNAHASQAVKCTLKSGTSGQVWWEKTLKAGEGWVVPLPRKFPFLTTAADPVNLITDAAGTIQITMLGD